MITDIFFKEWIKSISKPDNWDILQTNLLNNNYLDTQFHECNYDSVKGYIFEYLVKYLYQYLGYETYLYKEIPFKLKENLNLPNQDKGIDLIIKKDNEWVGIQCKWRKNVNSCLLKHYVTDFIYSINESKLSYGILLTNVKKITPNFNKNKKLKWIIYSNLCELITVDFLKSINAPNKINTNKEIINKIELRDYQKQAINNLINDKTSRKQCIMACGTGKTVIMIEYIKHQYQTNNKSKVLLLFPSLQLISQTYNRISNELKKKILCICSDLDSKSLTCGEANENEENNIYEEFLANDYNKIYTTDLNVIKKNLPKSDIVLCTYQSSKLLENTTFDLCIYDEAHKTVNNPIFSYTIDDNNCKVNTRIFFTATPRYYKGDNEDCISMCDTSKYGEEVYNYSFKKARYDKYLLDFQVISYVVDDAKLPELVEEKYIKCDNLKDIESNAVICAIQLAQHIKNGINNSKKILTYHSTVNKAIQFKKTLNYIFEKFDINANVYVMSGKTSMNLRKEIIKEFENEDGISIICSSKVLNEGVDIPIVDTVVFIDSRKSTIDVTQCVGRGLRLHNNYDVCSVIVPIMYDNIDNNHNFTPLINILTAMNEIDDKIIEYFTLGEKSNKIKISNMNCIEMKEFSNGENVKFKLEDVLGNLKTKVLSSNQLSWEFKKNILFEYCDKFGKVPKCNKVFKDINIGQWLSTQKKYINTEKSERYIKLNKNPHIKTNLDEYLKFLSKKDPNRKKLPFKESVKLLFEYCNDNKKIPSGNTIYKNHNIGLFLKNIKRKIKDKNCNEYVELTKNKMIKDDLDSFLNKRDPNKIKLKFKDAKLLLFEYCNLKKCIPAQKTKYKDFNIGGWVSIQKSKICNNNNDIYKELSVNTYVKKSLDEYLEHLNNKDPNKKKLSFDECKELVFEYCTTNKKIPTKDTYHKNYNIGQWLCYQKRKIINNKSKIYIELSTNDIVKEHLEEYLKYLQQKDPNKKVLSFEEGKALLFEYCNKNKKIPPKNIKYKNYNIRAFLQNAKNKIYDK